MKEQMSSLKSDKRKRFKIVVKKQKSQLRIEEESEVVETKAIEQKSQLPTKEGSDYAKAISVVFTFYKLLEFLEMLYNSI